MEVFCTVKGLLNKHARRESVCAAVQTDSRLACEHCPKSHFSEVKFENDRQNDLQLFVNLKWMQQ